jgi:nucleoid-associated protein YgaU
MLPATSRYATAEIATAVEPDGAGGTREVRYLRRRLLDPPAVPPAILATHRVGADDRLDVIAARYLGDPTAFWRIGDANDALDPDELVAPEAEGRLLVVPVPGV